MCGELHVSVPSICKIHLRIRNTKSNQIETKIQGCPWVGNGNSMSPYRKFEKYTLSTTGYPCYWNHGEWVDLDHQAKKKQNYEHLATTTWCKIKREKHLATRVLGAPLAPTSAGQATALEEFVLQVFIFSSLFEMDLF